VGVFFLFFSGDSSGLIGFVHKFKFLW
jgi:hypothetical protein